MSLFEQSSRARLRVPLIGTATGADKKTGIVHTRRARSLAARFSVFMTVLVLWVVLAALAVDLWDQTFQPRKAIVLCLVLPVAAIAIGRFTVRLLVRPLEQLHRGIASVREGRLEAIQVSRSGDEIEFLGERFNDMILTLAVTRREISEQHVTLEERIRQRTEALGEAMLRANAVSQAKSEFLANMSHELRTPMTGILGMIDVVLDSQLTHDQRDQLETAQRCANSLLALLNDLLDLSKIEAGKMLLERTPFELRRVLEDCTRSQLPRASQKGIEIVCDVAPEVPEAAVGDSLRLRQIVTNLLSNAVKFTEHGGVTLRATLGAGTPPGVLDLRLTVEDTGIGIPKDKLPAIFDNFTQADGSITRRYGGSGMGLAITRKLVELHGGSITVSSAPGAGSTFDVALPLAPAPVSVRRAEPDATGPREPVPSPRARILVVEDTEVNQKVLATILTRKGFLVEIARNGREALEAMERQSYDLVLMDVQMPVLDGLEATRLIRSHVVWCRVPIIAMTAHAMRGDRERCLEAGMDGYLAKPVNAAQLVASVQHHLALARETAQGREGAPASPHAGLARLESESERLNSRVVLLAPRHHPGPS